MRGAAVTLRGTASIGSGPCAHIRIDVHLKDARAGRVHAIGALSTDDNGAFAGAIVVPMEIPVGDYAIVVSSPGDETCGSGVSSP